MTPLQTTKANCASYPMSGEEYIARLYCEPGRSGIALGN